MMSSSPLRPEVSADDDDGDSVTSCPFVFNLDRGQRVTFWLLEFNVLTAAAGEGVSNQSSRNQVVVGVQQLMDEPKEDGECRVPYAVIRESPPSPAYGGRGIIQDGGDENENGGTTVCGSNQRDGDMSVTTGLQQVNKMPFVI